MEMRKVGSDKKESGQDTTTPNPNDVFPFVFDIDFLYRKIDRMAGFWESCGLETEILMTGAGYALVLHYPEAG